MLYPQLLVYEQDGLLAALLRPLAEERHWIIREPRRGNACVRLLRRGHPAVLVLRLGGDVREELSILEKVHWLCPEARSVVVGEVANPELIGLAWHLGASYVLAPPQPRNRLPLIVSSFMDAEIQRRRAPSEEKPIAIPRAEEEDLPEASLEDE